MRQLRISRDGGYALAQDDHEIVVLTLQPFGIAFRIPARSANLAQFTPDSTQVVFISSVDQMSQESLRRPGSEAHLERWDLAKRARVASPELPKLNCETAVLSPDGGLLVCESFDGVLRLVDTATGAVILQRKHFAKATGWDPTLSTFPPPRPAKENLGWSGVGFSPDARFLIVASLSAVGSSLIWDRRENRTISEAGELKLLRHSGANVWYFAFVAPDRVVFSHSTDFGVRKRGRLVAFPSGKLLATPLLPWGVVEPAADPNFVRLASPGWYMGEEELRRHATLVDIASGEAVISDVPALDILGSHYVAEVRNGVVGVYERGKGLQATVDLYPN